MRDMSQSGVSVGEKKRVHVNRNKSVINRLTNDVAKAKDNLLLAKMVQAAYANKSHGQK